MHSGTAIAIRDVPAAASHGTAGVLGGCQGSGCFGRRAAEDPLSSGWAGEAVRPPCYLLVVVLDVERVCGGGAPGAAVSRWSSLWCCLAVPLPASGRRSSRAEGPRCLPSALEGTASALRSLLASFSSDPRSAPL